jgi:hypothetical protein
MVAFLDLPSGAKRDFVKSPVREFRTPGSVRGHPGDRVLLPRYAPEIGRWPNRDPMEEGGGLNLQNFVDNSPVSASDAYGLFSIYLHTDGFGHVGLTDDIGNNYDYGRYRGTYDGKGNLSLTSGPNILVRSPGWPPQGKVNDYTIFKFNVCPKLDERIRKEAEKRLNAGQNTWPQVVLDKFKKYGKVPDELNNEARYMGSDWAISDSCDTFTMGVIRAALYQVNDDPNATERELKEARVLYMMVMGHMMGCTTVGEVKSMLQGYASGHDWIDETQGGKQDETTNPTATDDSCCSSSSK